MSNAHAEQWKKLQNESSRCGNFETEWLSGKQIRKGLVKGKAKLRVWAVCACVCVCVCVVSKRFLSSEKSGNFVRILVRYLVGSSVVVRVVLLSPDASNRHRPNAAFDRSVATNRAWRPQRLELSWQVGDGRRRTGWEGRGRAGKTRKNLVTKIKRSPSGQYNNTIGRTQGRIQEDALRSEFRQVNKGYFSLCCTC